MTFRLRKLYEILEKEVVDGVDDLDEISTMFGILDLDFKRPITIFEGPLDAFLFVNSVATCSSNIEFPIELSSLRYLYDYDTAGKNASIKKLASGKKVFLWKKFFQDAKIEVPSRKMDLTDLVVLSKRKHLQLPRLGNYFSEDRYDAYWI